MRSIDAAVLTTDSVKALAILKIQVHHDCGKELADNRRFTLATNIEAYFCDPQARGSAGPN
jgi:IS30 family transposase